MKKLLVILLISLALVSVAFAADTGFKSPTATGEDFNQWTDPTNAFSSNDVYATEVTVTEEQDYYNFTFGVPAGATIDGVEITVEGFCDGTVILNGDRCGIKIDISDDGGTSYGTKINSLFGIDAGEITATYGGATSGDAFWGLTLTDGDFSNTNFRARIELDTLTGGATTFDLDHLQVKVYYTAAAAGGARESEWWF